METEKKEAQQEPLRKASASSRKLSSRNCAGKNAAPTRRNTARTDDSLTLVGRDALPAVQPAVHRTKTSS